jgi:hypothetical protein
MRPHLRSQLPACYGLDAANALNDPENANERVIKRVEERFRTMQPAVPEFDHYAPSVYLLQNRDAALRQLRELDAALGRFEAIFG